MSDEPKVIDPAELRRLGYVEEVNRRFFHPLGLAMGVDDHAGIIVIYDAREDPEGFIFNFSKLDDAAAIRERSEERAAFVDAEMVSRREARIDLLGSVIQCPGGLLREDARDWNGSALWHDGPHQ